MNNFFKGLFVAIIAIALLSFRFILASNISKRNTIQEKITIKYYNCQPYQRDLINKIDQFIFENSTNNFDVQKYTRDKYDCGTELIIYKRDNNGNK